MAARAPVVHHTTEALVAWRDALARDRPAARVAIVPTMGALHAGHRALIDAARTSADVVVVTIFVNPTQFGPHEDFAYYPRPVEADLALCADAGADVVFAPATPGALYPPGAQTWVDVTEVTRGLCGEVRPGHFRGVTTVVAILFNLVRPHTAFFGKKDYQQWVVIRRMVHDLHMPVDVVGVETVREPGGLALSSRNAWLDEDERRRATALHRALGAARARRRDGEARPAALLDAARAVLTEASLRPEYLELRAATTLAPWHGPADGPAVMLVAARVGRARLIDNLEL
jgi:pantoate--beta-alanine ligase